MKFRLLTEDVDQPIPYEELEEDLKEEQKIEDSSVQYAIEQLEQLGFESNTELNGISLIQTIEDEDTTYKCQFYLDTEADNYSSYVTSESDGTKTTSFSQKGPIDEAPTAVDKFIKFLQTI